ncbi:MAG: NYN domain-containing protein [Pirellulales bacterium]
MVNDYSILIDGYNLIFQCGLEGRSRTPVSLQRARRRLIGELKVGLAEPIRRRTAIVFDATRLPLGESQPTRTESGLTIIYAIDHEDADTLIELLIQKNSTPKKLIVVSSDHRLHKAASRRKSTPIDSDEWFDQITGGSQKSAAHEPIELEGKPPLDHLNDVDWMAEFGIDQQQSLDGIENFDRKAKSEEAPNYDPFPPGYADDLLDGSE